jgi:hypothetical protein
MPRKKQHDKPGRPDTGKLANSIGVSLNLDVAIVESMRAIAWHDRKSQREIYTEAMKNYIASADPQGKKLADYKKTNK